MPSFSADNGPATEVTPLLREGGEVRDQEQLRGNGALVNGDAVDGEDADEEEEEEEDKNASPYLGGVSRTRFWVIYTGILLQYFVACFDSTLMASSHPVITTHFHASNSASWLSTAFLLTSTTFQPLLARLSDTIGRRPIYLFSLLTFALTTLWCALAPSITSFILARAACGLGAGGVLAMGAILTNDLVPLRIRGSFQAYINMFFGLGQACGAAFGGLLCERLGWRWTFGVQIPPVLAVLVLATFATPTGLGPNLAKAEGVSAWALIKTFDVAGSALLCATVAALILGLNLGGNVLPWTHPIVLGALATAAVAAPLLIHVERRATRPILPLAILTSAPRGNLVLSNFWANVGYNTILFNAPLFFQAVLLDTPTQSGIRLAFPSLSIMVCGVSSGFLMTWSGRTKPLVAVGSVMALAGSVVLACVWAGMPAWLATLFVVPTSAGLGLSFPATTLGVLSASVEGENAVVIGTLSLFRNLGAVGGVAISSLVVQNGLRTSLERWVTGPERDEIISRVRKEVRAIFDLDPLHQREVIHAYEHSLRNAFLFAIATFVVVNALVLPVRLPRLGTGRQRK